MLLEKPLFFYLLAYYAMLFPNSYAYGFAWAFGISLVFIALMAYLLGSIPFGLLLTKLAGKGDIRAIGSGNIGATNVLRTGSKKLAALTLLFDLLKAVAAVWLAKQLGASYLVAALFVVLGHMFPVWLRFRGGKGVATAIGAFLALSPILGFAVIAAWLAVFAATRISSLSALVSIGLSPVFAYFTLENLIDGQRIHIDIAGIGYTDIAGVVTVTLIALLVIARHHANIRRLIGGTEPKFGHG